MSDVFKLQNGANESDIAGAIARMKSGDTLILPENEIIEIRDGLKIDIASRNITIDLNGSTLHQAGDVTVLSANGTLSAAQQVGMDLGSANAKLTMASTSGLNVGDWIKVTADDVLPYDNRNALAPTRLGQAMQIASINGNTVEVVGQPLYADQYVTNVRAAEIISGTLTLRNGTVQGDQTHSTWNMDLVRVGDALSPLIEHLTVRDGNSMGINLVNTVNAKVVDSIAINLLDDTSIGHYGYGVHSASSLNTTVVGLYAERVRHATDDNGVISNLNDPNLSHYGADVGLTVKDSVAYYSSAFSYSFHSEGRNGVLDNVMSFESHGFVGLRGAGHQVLNSGSVGDERGLQYFEYGYGDSRDTLVQNTIVREAGRYVYVVQGAPTNNVIKDSYLEYDYRPGNPGSTTLVNTSVVQWNGVDDNIITGGSDSDRLLGGRGLDVLNGGAGADYIWGGAGNDILTGGSGADRFVFDHTDSIDLVKDFEVGASGDRIDVSILAARYGWKGDALQSGHVYYIQDQADTMVMVSPVLGAGAFAVARLQNVTASSIVAANLQTTISGGAAPSGPPVPTTTIPSGSINYAKGVRINGTTDNDRIDATHTVTGAALPTLGADNITTGAGDDYVDGLGGADSINTGGGNDTVVYYSGVASNLQGGSGRDTLILRSTDIIDLSSTTDQSEGLPVFSGFDDVDGRTSVVPLTIIGDKNNNNIWGGSADDTLKGGDGNDQIDGGAGVDVVVYDGNRDDYSFIRINDTTWRAQDLRGLVPYRDYLYNIERVSFDDQTAFIETLNRAPTDLGIVQDPLVENVPMGSLVGTLYGVDPDKSEINTWVLLNDAGGRFVIQNNLLVTNAAIDFEQQSSYVITVQLTDSAGHVLVKDLTIAATDANDQAPVITSAATIAMYENSSAVVTLTGTDADTTGETTTYTIDPNSPDAAYFTISGNQLQFVNAPDFEDTAHAPSYSVAVVASDGINSSVQQIAVTVLDQKRFDVSFGRLGDDVAYYDAAMGKLTLNDVSYSLSTLGFDTLDLRTGDDRFELAAQTVRIEATAFGIGFDLDNDGVSDFTVRQAEHIQVTGSDIAFTASLTGSQAYSAGDATLIGTAGNDRLDATNVGVAVSIAAGTGDDYLIGGIGSDTLNGGAGSDVMIGGAGDDTYLVDATGDLVVEAAGEGRDTVQTTLLSYMLGNAVEDLVYMGTRNFTGTGNALANLLQGGSGNDRLDGLGGADILLGGAGNDTYVVDDINDTVVEFAGQGTDRVLSTVSYTLSDNVENLQLTTSKAINGTGNGSVNTLLGNAGVNILDGRGGADVLTGGAGNDVFVFQRGEANGDLVTDFTGAGVVGGDRLEFRDYGTGALIQIGVSDYYVIQADAAHGGTMETIHLTGVFNLSAGDYVFL